jgi:hypothetical protein
MTPPNVFDEVEECAFIPSKIVSFCTHAVGCEWLIETSCRNQPSARGARAVGDLTALRQRKLRKLRTHDHRQASPVRQAKQKINQAALVPSGSPNRHGEAVQSVPQSETSGNDLSQHSEAVSDWRCHGAFLAGISVPVSRSDGDLSGLIRKPPCSIFVLMLRIVKRMNHRQ